jgi:hypothetical protein
MTSKSHRDIAAILPAYGFSRFATIADIAGGRATQLRAIEGSPKTQGILFTSRTWWQEVAPEDGEKLTVVGGNFFTDSMPKADAYLLMNIIHDWSDAESIKILSAIRRAMSKRARVLIIETVVPDAPGPLSRGTRHRRMVLPGGGAHSGGICQLGCKVRSSLGVHGGDAEPIFSSRTGRRLNA